LPHVPVRGAPAAWPAGLPHTLQSPISHDACFLKQALAPLSLVQVRIASTRGQVVHWWLPVEGAKVHLELSALQLAVPVKEPAAQVSHLVEPSYCWYSPCGQWMQCASMPLVLVTSPKWPLAHFLQVAWPSSSA